MACSLAPLSPLLGLALLVAAGLLHWHNRRLLDRVHACNDDFAEACRCLERGDLARAEALAARWRGEAL